MAMEKKRIIRLALIGAAILVLLLLTLPLFINANSFRPQIEERLSAALGRKVQVGDLGLSIFSGSVSAANLTVADDPKFSSKPFLTAKSLRVGVQMWPLIISRSLKIRSLTVDKPEIELIRNQQGQWNFSSMGRGSGNAGSTGTTGDTASQQKRAQTNAKDSQASVPDFQVAALQLNDGQARVGSVGAKANLYSNVNVEASDVSLKSQFPVQLSASSPGGGNLKLDGKAGPVDASDTSRTPVNAKLTIEALDLARTGFVDPTNGMSGLLNAATTLASTGGTAQAQGNATITKLQLVKGGAPSSVPVQLDFGVDYNLANSTGTLKHGAVKIGKAVGQLSGTFEQNASGLILNTKVTGQGLPVPDLQAALPAFGVILPKGSSLKSGTATADLNVQGPVDKLTIAGNVGLFNAQLAGFDLNSKMAGITKLVGTGASTDTSIQKFTANVRVNPSGIQAQAIDAVVPALGQVTGAGTVSASGALNFAMVAAVSSSGALGSVPGMQRVTGGGAAKLPFSIEGTTSDPKFVPNVKGMAGSAVSDIVKSKAGGVLEKSPLPEGLGGLLGTKPKGK
jgi:AsmA protein